MLSNVISAAFTTNKVEESRDFHVKYFDAVITFDRGWYANLEFGKKTSTLQFMSPQQPEQKLGNSAGLTYNFEVEDVNQEFEQYFKN